jgi:hypothetical protein
MKSCPECGQDYEPPPTRPDWLTLLEPGARKICEANNLVFIRSKFVALLESDAARRYLKNDEYTKLTRAILKAMK